MEDGAHQVPHLGLRSSGPLNAVHPLLYCDWFDLIETMVSPARQNPSRQIAFVSGSRGKRLAALIVTSELFESVVVDQLRDRLRRTFRLRGSLVCVDAQCMSCFEGRCFCK